MNPVLPGGTLGMLGGGQLGRMFTMEARRMGYNVIVVDPDPDAPAAHFANHHIIRKWTDSEALGEIAERCRAVTTEFENVPADALRALAARVPVRPNADAVATTQDRAVEKQFVNAQGIPTTSWAPLEHERDVGSLAELMGSNGAILKTARMGYDGKGQRVVHSVDEVRSAWDEFGQVACVLEQRVELDREVSVLVARGVDGATVTWPVGENVHRNGILHTTTVPASIDDDLASAARAIAVKLATALDYVGVLAVEMFITRDGELLVNELAPRPHNSGHWTLDACVTSQFEQQVRTTAGLPLGDTSLLAPCVMTNLLGDLWQNGEPDWAAMLREPGLRLHLYGKKEPRPGRKMGHVVRVGGAVIAVA